MKHYQYILFDWDGCLAQTLDLWPDALDVVLRKQSIELERSELIEACGGVAAFLSTHTKLSESGGNQILSDATELVKERLIDVELYPDVVGVLNELKCKGKKLAVITSSVRSVVEPLLKKYELKNLFDAVVCIEDTENRKPHAEPVLKAIEIMDGNKDEAIMVGDTEKDILAAHNAGVDSALFYPLEHKELYDHEKLIDHKPTYVISESRDVIKIANGNYDSAG